MGGNGQRVKNDDLELLDETAAKSEFESFINANEGNHEKYVVFTFKNELSRATQYTVQVPQGCPSAEGPLTSVEAWSGSFQTYEPLKIVDWSPNKKHTWQPSAALGQSWSVTFNNPLDHSTINKSMFKIEPEVSGLGKSGDSRFISSPEKTSPFLGIEHAEHNNQHLIIYNNSKPNTVYTLTIQSGILKDIHGQTFEHDRLEEPIEFQVHDPPPLVGDISGATGT
jgi:hypothetical protein